VLEKNCWLQERLIAASVPDTVYSEEGGEVAAQAVREFCAGIRRVLGVTPNVVFQKKPEKKDSGVFLGIVPGKSSEGFDIKVTEKIIIIAGHDEPGLLYGVFRFLFLLALGEITDGLELAESPVSPLRIINHWDNLDGTVERGYAGSSLFFKDGRFCYDKQRIEDYARLLASVGINRLSINNVNVRGEAKFLITEKYLSDAAALAAIFRRFGIRLFISINFNAPVSVGNLPTADPLDPAVTGWWMQRAALVNSYIPDLAGFIVKADSEGESGPFQYNRTHADGANMLAKAVNPFGGVIIWRCFVYNCSQDWRDLSVDRARASYDHFMPLDGMFSGNVILQIKYGPLDFQVSEPVSPLFGTLKKTRHVMELQITQEYTGQQTDLFFLPCLWEEILRFEPDDRQIKDLVRPCAEGCAYIEGFAAVANVGLDTNWTGNTLAQANLYGYGRLCWNPSLSAAEIAREWAVLSFGKTPAAQTIAELLMKSCDAYEKYTAPFGVGFMVTPGSHYGPNIEGYEYSRWGTYHRADMNAIGVDRTSTGTGFTSQYSAKNAAVFSDKASCPENLLLFFHRLRYNHIMKNGETLLQNIYDTHFEGYEEAAAMLETWKGLKNAIDDEVYRSVLDRFERQLVNAREWRDQINTYFWRKTGIPDRKGRMIYE
jgi:alpha-glucuronidase